jgi:hypothetical protein
MKIFTGLFFQILFPVLFAIFLTATTVFYQSKDTNKFLIFGLLSWISVGFAIVVFIKPNINLENDFSGVIMPANQPRPKSDLVDSVPPNAFLILLGNSVAWSEKLPVDILNIKNESVLSIDEKDGNILLSAKLFDDKNKIVAELRDNEWFINPNNFFRKERPNKSQLIIFDQKSDEILNLDFINNKTIKITGIFRHKNLRGSVIFTNEYAVFPGNNRFYDFNFGSIGKAAIKFN